MNDYLTREELGEAINVQELAREIAARMAPDALLDAADVASLIKCSPRQVLERYVGSAGFPKAIRLRGADGARSHPKWMRSDVVGWIQAHREGRSAGVGRPRKPL